VIVSRVPGAPSRRRSISALLVRHDRSTLIQ